MHESYEIARCWFEALSGSATLAQFCQARFGELPEITMGRRLGEQGGESKCPYVALLPLTDQGGFEVETATSEVAIGLGCIDQEEIAVGTGVLLRGLESIREFERVVLTVLENTEIPPSSWSGRTAQPGRFYFERAVVYEINQDRTI
jgi:hypothetical protein